MKNKLKLLQELNKTRLSEIKELREITKEQSHRDFYDGQISELNWVINYLEDIINTQGGNMRMNNENTNLKGSALSGTHF